MPETEVIIYQEKEDNVPLIEWLDSLSADAQDKCYVKIELLKERGYKLRRPHSDILKDGIYELRARKGNVHYRILYAFVGRNIVLLSHGCFKKDKVPSSEIKRAIRNRVNYLKEPEEHTYRGEV